LIVLDRHSTALFTPVRFPVGTAKTRLTVIHLDSFSQGTPRPSHGKPFAKPPQSKP
jgi:hypothetical protein